MKVIVGLGNPGRQYSATRHNVGFDTIDLIAAGPGVEPFRSRFQAHVAEMKEAGEAVLLVKPETFMNLSGRSVRQVVDFYKLDSATDVLVVCDDIALPLGKLRVRMAGSHGGHNGLRSIQEQLGGSNYARLRLGVDAPRGDQVDYVLGRFKPSERPVIEDAVRRAADAALVWVRDGIAACMNRFNGDPDAPKKPKKPKPETNEPKPSPRAAGGTDPQVS